MSKFTKEQMQKYCGTAYVGLQVFQMLTKEEWAAVAYHLALYLDAEEPIKAILQERQALQDCGIIKKQQP